MDLAVSVLINRLDCKDLQGREFVFLSRVLQCISELIVLGKSSSQIVTICAFVLQLCECEL